MISARSGDALRDQIGKSSSFERSYRPPVSEPTGLADSVRLRRRLQTIRHARSCRHSRDPTSKLKRALQTPGKLRQIPGNLMTVISTDREAPAAGCLSEPAARFHVHGLLDRGRWPQLPSTRSRRPRSSAIVGGSCVASTHVSRCGRIRGSADRGRRSFRTSIWDNAARSAARIKAAGRWRSSRDASLSIHLCCPPRLCSMDASGAIERRCLLSVMRCGAGNGEGSPNTTLRLRSMTSLVQGIPPCCFSTRYLIRTWRWTH